MTYTASALLGVAFALALDLFVLRTRLVLSKAFWASYAVIVAFQLIVNGVLTGRQLVVYSGASIIGRGHPTLLGDWHVGYAPVEDLLFGFSLVLQTVSWWVWWGRHDRSSDDLDVTAGPVAP